MQISRQIIVFDAADLTAESSFWANLLGGTVADDDDDWHTVMVGGEPRIGIQLAPEHQQPDWPNGTPQQMHLDIYVDDIGSAHDEAIALGAKPLQVADNTDTKAGFQVYADPAGHPFCLCWG